MASRVPRRLLRSAAAARDGPERALPVPVSCVRGAGREGCVLFRDLHPNMRSIGEEKAPEKKISLREVKGPAKHYKSACTAMFLHIEMSMDVEARIPAGDTPHLLFEDEVTSPINSQMEVNYVTFWDLVGSPSIRKLPILAQLVQVKGCAQERIMYSAALADALEEAISLTAQVFVVRLLWVGASKSAEDSVLHLRMDVDTRRSKNSFSHIKREVHIHDGTSLPAGHSHIVSRV